MTNQRLSMADLPKFFLGFDRLENDFFASTVDGGYPRYNVVKVGEGYRVEVAIPGWDKSDIEISLHKNVLSVKGTRKQVENPDETYIYKGLSGKCFARNFKVGEFIKLSKAYMDRGLLCIDLVEELPEEERPVTISIS
ncbi:MAG: Hsp20 family protein [Burkholderiaceae bacterium]